jgi:hypothetical protein
LLTPRIARRRAEADDNFMRPVLLAVLLSLAGAAGATDPAAQAQLLRQQQSDAFALQLQQSLQSFRAGPLTPERRLELDSLMRDQRLNQADTFYRQQLQQAQPVAPAPGSRSAELLRFEPERAMELDRARAEAANAVVQSRPPPRPEPNPEPGAAWGPVLR